MFLYELIHLRLSIRRAVLKKLSSKFDELLAERRNSAAIMASIFMRQHVANPRPLHRLLRVIVLCFYEQKINNVAFRPRRDVYAALLMGLRNR